MITSERIEQAVGVVSSAARKAAQAAIDDLVERGVLTGENFQRILAQGDKVVASVTLTVTQLLVDLAENLVGRLKLISGSKEIILKPTNGREMIGRAKSIFRGYIDSDFENYGCNVEGKPTTETPVQVYEMIKDGNFAQIFGGFGENLDRLCLSQEQIIDFITYNRDWLRTEGYGTFFLFKVGDEFFVAFVYVDSDGHLNVNVGRLSYDYVWYAECRHRFVIPQLTTLES